ncbi:hypothetical protein J7481_23875 [Labrenzia sp. R4_2]|uniref:hypothetical protein n=1 Tax=Stappiaceae TaxID=2821832 RepID=UPI001ADA97F2|nr:MULTISPECIES: hypothetical protein [Stappiaceae]MBO9422568.1 hypothetical protein [Labrenzia sp. R4_2]
MTISATPASILRTRPRRPNAFNLADNVSVNSAASRNGTPGFVIGDEILRGATDLQTMPRLIDQARKDRHR